MMVWKSSRLWTTLLAAVLLSGAAAYAQAEQDDSILEELNLTEAQKSQLQDLRETFRNETQQIRSEIKNLLDEEKKLKSASTPNETELRSVLKKRADKEVELALAINRFNEGLSSILTPQQKRTLEKLKSQRKSR